jgi:hypothetical protein
MGGMDAMIPSYQRGEKQGWCSLIGKRARRAIGVAKNALRRASLCSEQACIRAARPGPFDLAQGRFFATHRTLAQDEKAGGEGERKFGRWLPGYFFIFVKVMYNDPRSGYDSFLIVLAKRFNNAIIVSSYREISGVETARSG